MLDAQIEMKSSEGFKFRSHNERKLLAIFVHKTSRSSYNWYTQTGVQVKMAIPNLQMAAKPSSETAITTTFQRPYLSHSWPRQRQISHSVQLFANDAFAVLHSPTISMFSLLHTWLFCTSNWLKD